MSLTAVYPAVNPLLLIFSIQSYRRKVCLWFHCFLPLKYKNVCESSSGNQVTKQQRSRSLFIAPNTRHTPSWHTSSQPMLISMFHFFNEII
ncbi:hypothetical protein PENTCL1PPCAC_24933 [Pristionchus entomophagus]|uniref:G protein-coupled receptor n=1 Tax=Pristionchus entomophagus TaxID=358040 RepID=A0AAV5U8P3_9BILA|nr:hypothetical protein PENTCL1PPCAC_24933 [Pristionchus entomophagus]